MSQRKQYSPEQKVSIVRRHLLENVLVSDLWDEFGIHATQYYQWQNSFSRTPRARLRGVPTRPT
jgi:transposase-like protein